MCRPSGDQRGLKRPFEPGTGVTRPVSRSAIRIVISRSSVPTPIVRPSASLFSSGDQAHGAALAALAAQLLALWRRQRKGRRR
jgi:MYXO-CTERM domain-containing protein